MTQHMQNGKKLLNHILYSQLETLFFSPVYYSIRIWLTLQEISLRDTTEALILSQVIQTYFPLPLITVISL